MTESLNDKVTRLYAEIHAREEELDRILIEAIVECARTLYATATHLLLEVEMDHTDRWWFVSGVYADPSLDENGYVKLLDNERIDGHDPDDELQELAAELPVGEYTYRLLEVSRDDA